MPIDIASGTATLDYEDVAIPGKIALVWDRHYSTGLLQKPPTPLGYGWTCRYFVSLNKTKGGFVFVTAQGAIEILEDPDDLVARGGVIRQFGAFLEIFRQADLFVVQTWNIDSSTVRRYCFAVGPAGQPSQLASIEDETGRGVDTHWDRAGRLVAVRQRLERRQLLFGYNADGYIESVTLEAANGERHLLVRYEYDRTGRQLAARDAADLADRYDYDEQGRIAREIVKDGGVFHYRYDDKGRCVLRSGLDRYNEKRLRYIDGARITEVTDSYDRKFIYQHLPSGQAVLEVDALGGKRNSEYDQYSRRIKKTDANGGVTQYEYDENGNLASVIDALGQQVTFSYNDHHLPVSMTDAAGGLWRRTYDQANRLIATFDPLGNQWQFGYDQEGNVVRVTNPLGAHKSLSYRDGILQAISDWVGNTTEFQFDAFGRVIERIGAFGERTRFRYDVMGNPVEVQLPDGATLFGTYDHSGNLTRFIDANGHASHWRFGPCRRLIEQIDQVGGTVRYCWGSEPGRLEQVINEKGEAYTFVRDDGGRVISERGFDGAERHFSYDAEGYTIGYTNAVGETVRIQRDALHRVIRQLLPDGEQVSFVYDRRGNLEQATNASIALSFERDVLGRIVREVQGEHWVASSYNVVGSLIRTETSAGHAVDYEVNANGFVTRLRTLNDQSVDFERDAYGAETLRRTPGGGRIEQRYDAVGRLVEQSIVSPGQLGAVGGSVDVREVETARRSYAYSATGALMRIEDGRWGWVNYLYDPAERLLEVLRERGTNEAFEYDATGNITRIEGGDESPEVSLIYGPGNRLLQKGRTRYEYDEEGRRVKMIVDSDAGEPKIWLYEWNALDRLKAVTRPDGEVCSYRYDPLARRIAQRGPQGDTRFVWDKDVVVHELQGSECMSSWIFDSFSFAPIATVQHSSVYNLINDHLGTPNEVIDQFGKLVWKRSYTVWGAEWSRNETNDQVRCPIRFQGHWCDANVELNYNRFRYYDPHVGAFLTQDPLGLFAGNNLYRAKRAPTRFIDPLGLCDTTDLPANSLTSEEAAELQAIADRFGTQVDVIGSRAEGAGRDIDRPDLPPGKGPGTRSDIDVRIDGQVDIDTRGALSDAVSGVGGGAGSVASSTGLPSDPPAIVFRPNQPPLVKR
jgi:RHS repeat-associated protein